MKARFMYCTPVLFMYIPWQCWTLTLYTGPGIALEEELVPERVNTAMMDQTARIVSLKAWLCTG